MESMRLQKLFTDDDAVSPVIGVILMVAITVILAAVIASFVLGLGNQSQVAPQASLSFEFDNSTANPNWDGNLTINHDSGDAVVADELFLRGDAFNTSGASGNNTWERYEDAGFKASISGSSESQPAVVAGDQLELGADTTYDISVVWEASEGDASSTLGEDTGPDA